MRGAFDRCFGMIVAGMTCGGRVVFVELPGAIGAVEFMAFAGHTGKRGRHQQQGE